MQVLLSFNYLFVYLAVSDLSCSTWDTHCRTQTLVVACSLSSWGAQVQVLRGLWDLRSPTRDRTHIPCIARQTLMQFLLAFYCYLSQMSNILLSFPLFIERKQGRKKGERRREMERKERSFCKQTSENHKTEPCVLELVAGGRQYSAPCLAGTV